MSVVLTEQYVREHIGLFCKHDPLNFFKRVSPTVRWQVMGTIDISGDYHSLEEFQTKAFSRVGARLDGHMTLTLTNCFVSGQQAAVELVVDVDSVKQNNGQPFPNVHCWIVQYDDKGVLNAIKMYMDSKLMQELIVNNPGP